MKKDETISYDELIIRLAAYLDYNNIDTSKLDAGRIARTFKRAINYKEKYLDMKETYNELAAASYVEWMLRFYLWDPQVKSSRKLDVARELLKIVGEQVGGFVKK